MTQVPDQSVRAWGSTSNDLSNEFRGPSTVTRPGAEGRNPRDVKGVVKNRAPHDHVAGDGYVDPNAIHGARHA